MGNIGTVVLLLTGAPLALAQSSPQPAQDGMLKNGPPVWDANHDSVYTCEEWKSFADRLFTSADRNRDGHLDPSEFVTVPMNGSARSFDNLAARGDCPSYGTKKAPPKRGQDVERPGY